MPEMLPAALESFFPGFSLISRILSFYLHIDLSSYSVYLILLTVLPPFFGFVLPRFFDNLQQVLLCFTASIEIPYQDRLHTQFIRWMSTNDSLRRSSRCIAREKVVITPPWQYEEDDEEENEDLEDQAYFESDRGAFWLSLRRNIKPIRFTPSQRKLHFFQYQRCILAVYRDPEEYHNNVWFTNAEVIRVYSFFWSKKVLLSLLQEVQQVSIDRKKERITIHRGFIRKGTSSWVPTTSKVPRPLATLVLPRQIKEQFLEDIETFLSSQNKDWYQSRGIPYRRGYLLYGPPGTGKSSMCFAIAGRLWLDIYTISLNSRKLDEDGLASLFQGLPKRCIVLLEDVDTAGLREAGNLSQAPANADGPEKSFEDKEPDGGGISLSALLNVLDGVGAHEGRILIMTTNHLEKLDAALTRPGRVDKMYYLGFADTPSIKQLFSVFYAATIDEGSTCDPSNETGNGPANQSARENHILSEKFAHIVSSGQFTAAEVINYLMDFKDDPEAAVEKANDWVMYKKEAVMPRD
ncbi:hypothetical protein Aspvir_008499 [Aspergillus viridinutans]|uniref:Uncharacterized protein n=1 Tax=Aspergillus viridinutans TaxID=75553 RepID=A0A9P3C3C4_ASPVI|nr:uncharacterized protein Aspvir_008499 [Aspergillus viridinutans]GIK04416.1 hypothetical protein Aspvir_008499 [Aspergillus viridinutans]